MPARDPQIDFTRAPVADPARGLFETMLVVDERVIERRAHLERLAASFRRLYGAEAPAGLEREVGAAAAGQALARLRLEVAPDPLGGTARVTAAAAAIDPAIVLPGDEVELATVSVAAGWGSHKLIDRSWLAAIEQAAGEGVRALLVTRAGALLESTRANVLLLRDGALATPPLDGSILPGVTRGIVLEHARALAIAARETPLTLEDLHASDAVLLSGAVRRLEFARVRELGTRSAEALARLRAALDVVSTSRAVAGRADTR